MYDIVIIGSGPAGLAAAIYAQRAKLNTLVIEENFASGGQVLNTYEVDNYPGFIGINGYDLGMKFKEHADNLNAVFINEGVKRIEASGIIKRIYTDTRVIESRTIIIASGANHRKLLVTGEEEFAGLGVSYCATCDGAFFKNKTVVVVGGGDVAVEDALFLSRLCQKVYIIHRRDELRAAMSLQEKIKEQENIQVIWNSVIESINGSEKVETVTIRNKIQNAAIDLNTDGVFIAVGIIPNSKIADADIEKDQDGYIIAGEDCKTNIEGVFAAGDVRTKQLRQIITAAADGANAITSAQNYLITSKKNI